MAKTGLPAGFMLGEVIDDPEEQAAIKAAITSSYNAPFDDWFEAHARRGYEGVVLEMHCGCAVAIGHTDPPDRPRVYRFVRVYTGHHEEIPDAPGEPDAPN